MTTVINLLTIWLKVFFWCAVAVILLRPIIKYYILNHEKFWEKLLLTLYELAVAALTIEGIILPLPLVLLLSVIMPNRRAFLHRQGRFWTRIFLWMLCVEVKVEGKENLPSGTAIYVQNYANYLYGAATLAYLPFNFRFVFLRHFFEFPFLGWLERILGFLALEPEEVSIMHDDVLEILKTLNRKESIVVFTEGKEVRSGVALFALQSKLPVVPAAVSCELTQPEIGAFFVKPFPRIMTIKIGAPITTGTAGDDHRLRQEMRSKIQAELLSLITR